MKRKKALSLLGVIMLLLSACNANSNGVKIGENEFYWQKQYEKADYEKFKTPASENGLDGTLIYVKGTVVDVKKDGEFTVILVDDANDNQWAYSVYSNNTNIPSINDEIIAYSDYGGIATKLNNQPHGALFRYIKGSKIYNMTYKSAYSDFAYWYPSYEGYPDEHITDVKEEVENKIDYFDIRLTYSDNWDKLNYGDQCDIVETCIEYCADRATAYGIPQNRINVFAYKTDGQTIFSYDGGNEVRFYTDGKYDFNYFLE